MKITKNEVVLAYVNEGKTTKEIAEIANVSARYIRSVLAEYNVNITEKRQTDGYKVDVDFFKTWSNEMAYVLGFILTDGYVTGNTLKIAQKSPEILSDIQSAMKTNIPFTKRPNGKSFIYELIINRKEIVKDLALLGINPNKSKSVEFPPVPTDYLPHFIRGVIDGDGWVQNRGYVANVTSGSRGFANQLHEVFNAQGFNGRISEDSNVYRIWVSGKDDVKRLGEWVYKDVDTLYLRRKRERFEINVHNEKEAV